MKTRFIKEIGTRVYLRIFCFSSTLPPNTCSHDAKVFIKDLPGHFLSYDRDGHAGGEPQDYPEEMWPKVCDACGQPFPDLNERQVFNHRLYDSPSGRPEPGDLFYVDWYPEKMYWDNHTGPHLMAVCPGGREWLIDGRASNCDQPDERTHRCWVRHGSPESGTIHIDKSGHTCGAGGGSIDVGNYHGFLHNGSFT